MPEVDVGGGSYLYIHVGMCVPRYPPSGMRGSAGAERSVNIPSEIGFSSVEGTRASFKVITLPNCTLSVLT